MISGNVAFKKQLKKVNYADITLRDGTVLNLEPTDFALGKFSMKDETTTGKFGVGHAVGKTMNISIANHTNKFSMYDFYKSIIYMYVSVTTEEGEVLKERKGKYYVIDPATTGEIINIQGVDSMSNFDRPYEASTVFPATLQSILTDCCLDCGVNIGFGQFDNYNFVVNTKPTDCTYRQVVSWVCQIAGYNARISNNDYLELVWYDFFNPDILNGGNLYDLNFEDTYDGGDFETYEDSVLFDGGYFTEPISESITRIKSINVSTDDVVITGVKVKNDKTEVLVGTEDYCIVVSGNDLSLGQESKVANYLAQRLVGLQFRPLTCEIPNNPLVEPYDCVYVNDRKGNSYFTLINSVSYSVNGFTTIQCKADDPVRNEKSYTSESAKAVLKARRETADQLTTYDKAVQSMNLLASNAMGLYRETEKQTAGDIYYMSNKPIYKNENGVCEFIADAFVYKMTGDGFFVSTDGGLSYTSGFDAEGNVVVNVLSAIGITFDWAKGGTLTLGGADNVNGSMIVLDSAGDTVGKFNKDGLWAKNGYFEGIIKSSNAEITGGYINISTSSKDYSSIRLTYSGYSSALSAGGLILINGSDYVDLSQSGLQVGNSTSKYAQIIKSQIRIGTSNDYTLMDGDKFFVTNGSASVIIKPSEILLNASKLTIPANSTINCSGNTYFNGSNEFGTLSTITFNGKVVVNGDFTTDSAGIFSVTRQADFSGNVNVSGTFQTKGTTKLCDATYDTLGFFGGSGASKQTVNTITSPTSSTASANASKINEVINALKKYNLI